MADRHGLPRGARAPFPARVSCSAASASCSPARSIASPSRSSSTSSSTRSRRLSRRSRPAIRSPNSDAAPAGLCGVGSPPASCYNGGGPDPLHLHPAGSSPMKRLATRLLLWTLILPYGGATIARGRQTEAAGGFTPEEAVRRMVVPEGFHVEVFAAEPMVRQPVTACFDERGRLWVVEYLQYPNPAGLKPVTVDQYLRTEYDRVPEPPPRGPRGRGPDQDPRGHRRRRPGRFGQGVRRGAEPGLGAGGRARGRLRRPGALPPVLPRSQPRRPARRRPRGPARPGFGLQDAHATVNSMTWGPDGWLYGRRGARSPRGSAAIEFQQGDLALSSPRPPVRGLRRGGRQYLGARLRPDRQRLRQQQRGVHHVSHGPGRLLPQGLRQARPAAQPARLRLFRPDRLPRAQARRPRHARAGSSTRATRFRRRSAARSSAATCCRTPSTGTCSSATARRSPAGTAEP